MGYAEFLESKSLRCDARPVESSLPINGLLFDWQRDIVTWALRRGRAALFEDCGLGKTAQQLEWARHVCAATGGNVLILTPLAVAHQTLAEAGKFGIEACYARQQSQAKPGITITNYEMLEHFNASQFSGVILDESSILKAFMGKTKRALLEAFSMTPYRLCCTATPAPNDHLELGNHAEFLGIMPSNEMISRWFINDAAQVGHYRLKGHAAGAFWEWVASWAVCISRPSDLGYSDEGFDLPPLHLREVVVAANNPDLIEENTFLPAPALNATNIHRVMRSTSIERAIKAAEIVARETGPVAIWCNTDYEADALTETIPDAVEVRGSESQESKERKLDGFVDGAHRIIITKPRIAGFGLNWQHCNRIVFMGLSYSYEQLYQAIRRCYRFGQTRPVIADIIVSDAEVGILDTIRRKQAAHLQMQDEMVLAMREAGIANVNPKARLTLRQTNDDQISIPEWLVA